MKQKGFFDENNRLNELSKLGNPLEKLNNFINWEGLRKILTNTLDLFDNHIKTLGFQS